MKRCTVYLFLLIACISCGLFKKKQRRDTSAFIQKDTAAGREIYYQSEAAFLLGNLEESKNLFLRFIESSPEPGAGYFRLAEIAVRQNKITEALDWNQKALRYELNNYYYKLQQAELMENIRDFESAGDIFYSLATTHPKHWTLFQEAADNYKRANNSNKLIRLCQLWENAFGLREEIAENYNAGYEKKGLKDSIIYIQKKLIHKYPERRKYKQRLGEYYLSIGEDENALLLFNEILKEDPENANIVTVLCNYHSKTNSYGTEHWKTIFAVAANRKLAFSAKEQCILSPFTEKPALNKDSLKHLLQIITSHHGNESKVLQVAGDFYFDNNDFSKAVIHYGKLLKLNQNLYTVWISLLNSLDSLHQYKRMLTIADSMLQVFPTMVSPYYYTAGAFHKLKEFDQSLKICEEGMAFAIDNGQKNRLLLIMANNLKYINWHEEALLHFNKVLATDPVNAEAYEGIGDVKYFLNKVDDALRNWQKAKELGLHSVILNNKIKNKKIE